MPDGAVLFHGVSVDLGAIEGHESHVPLDEGDLADLGMRWVSSEPSDARSLALARSELLRTPPGASAAMQWLDRVAAPDCTHHRVRALAHLVASKRLLVEVRH